MPSYILCCGLLIADLKFTTANFPSKDEKVFADSFNFLPGGPATNAALTISQLGSKTKLLSSTGRCPLSESLIATLSFEGVDTDDIQQSKKALNVAAIFSEHSGERRAISFKSKGLCRLPDSLPEPSIILLDGHQPEASLALIERFPEVPSILDAGSVHEGTESLAPRVNWLITSQKYAQQKCSEKDLNKALKKLAKINPNTAITCGASGVLYSVKGSMGQIDGIDVNCLDSNGAGDVFHGAFAHALSIKMPWLEALNFANQTAAKSCESYGIIDSLKDQ